VYAALTKMGFTSEQVGSLLIAAEMKAAGLDELKKYEQEQLRLAVAKRKAAITTKRKKIAALGKRQVRLRKERDSVSPASKRPNLAAHRSVLVELRDLERELAFCKNWVAQKTRVLAAKEGSLKTLDADIAAKRYRLCFGSKKLLAQRPAAHNAETTPFASVEDWRKAWSVARDGQWWSVGRTAAPQGNAEVQWNPESKQLRLRLTNRIAEERMAALGVPTSGGNPKIMAQRMTCRFVIIDDVDFLSHRGAAKDALTSAYGVKPVTMRILKRIGDDGMDAWYVQATVDVDTGFQPESATQRRDGVMGVDMNVRGVAWCAVKPDGNRLVVDGIAQRGFFHWDLRGKTEDERKQTIGTVAAQLVAIASHLSLPVALENLDFSTKKAGLKAGVVNQRFNEMLSSFATTKFSELLSRGCEKRGIAVYRVNPLYSSVGGYVKYGRLNHCSPMSPLRTGWLGKRSLAPPGKRMVQLIL
jgi:IS605 OrfB family transposase